MLSDRLVVFDNLSSRMFLIVHVEPAVAKTHGRMGNGNSMNWRRKLNTVRLDRTARPVQQSVCEQDFTSEFTQQGFEAAVEKARRYIIDGDAMQIVLSQRLSIPYRSTPIDLYRALRVVSILHLICIT